jgi:hypothetical protein
MGLTGAQEAVADGAAAGAGAVRLVQELGAIKGASLQSLTLCCG